MSDIDGSVGIANSEKPRQKRPWKVFGVSLAVVVIVLWRLTPSGGIDRPVKLERDDAGRLQNVSEGADQNVTLKMHAGVVDARNSVSTSTASSHSDPAWFAAESLTILNQSDHLLMKRVGEILLNRLKDQSTWEEVYYLPQGHALESELKASDIYMILDLASLEEAGLVRGHVKASISASISNGLPASSYSVHDSLSSVMVEFRANSRLEHESTLTGLESAGARYSMQAENIADEIIKVLEKQVSDLKEKHSSPPPAIAKLMADYRPAPDFTELGSLQLIASTHREMVHNDTLWSLKIDGDVAEFIENTASLLQKRGWSEYSKEINEHVNHLRMQDGTKWLELYPRTSPFISSPDDLRKGAANEWYIRYRERMSRTDLETFFQQLLDAENRDVNFLLGLERLASHDQREALFKLMEDTPPSTAKGFLRMAQWYFRKDQTEEGTKALQRANAMSVLSEERNDLLKKIEEVIKQHKLDKKSVMSLNVETLAEIGVQTVTVENPKASQKFKVNSSAAFVVPSEEPDKWTFFGTEVLQAEHDKYRLVFFQGSETGRRGHSSMCCLDLDQERKHQANVNENKVVVRINKIDSQQFEAKIELQTESKADEDS